MLLFTPNKMKNYADMEKDEKTDAVRLLKLGRNPWVEARSDNWQIERMGKELNKIKKKIMKLHLLLKMQNLLPIIKERIKIFMMRRKII